MSFAASDGKEFSHPMQREKYEKWLGEKAKAPGGLQHEQDSRLHGPATEVTIRREGLGRHVVTAKHVDGYTHQSVHPEAYRAHEVASSLLGIEPPPAVGTLGRSRAHPTGPKEKERVDREDNRRPEEDENDGA